MCFGKRGVIWVLMKGNEKWEVKDLLLAYGQLCFSGLCDERI